MDRVKEDEDIDDTTLNFMANELILYIATNGNAKNRYNSWDQIKNNPYLKDNKELVEEEENKKKLAEEDAKNMSIWVKPGVIMFGALVLWFLSRGAHGMPVDYAPG